MRSRVKAGIPEPARHRLLLQGGNGSGKTTVLETVRVLWEFLGEWIDRGQGKPPTANQSRHFLFRSDFAALELRGFAGDDRSLWVGIAGANDWSDLKRSEPNAVFAGLVRYGKKPEQARIELPAGRDWKTLRDSSLVGREPLPNIVHFPPDNRTVVGPPKGGARLIDTKARKLVGVLQSETGPRLTPPHRQGIAARELRSESSLG